MEGVEAPLANWIADAMRASTRGDIALVNRQYYRGSPIRKGMVDMSDLLNAMGVNDEYLITTELTGSDILEILDDNVPDPAKDRRYVKDGPYASRLVEISGAHYAYDPCRQAGQRIVSSD